MPRMRADAQGRRRLQRSEKLTLAGLASFRGQSVDDVLRIAFEQHQERSNYNNQQDVVGALERMALNKEDFKRFFPSLTTMMASVTTSHIEPT